VDHAPIYYIHPRVEHISAFDFDHLREVVEEGYRATIAALDRPAEWPGQATSASTRAVRHRRVQRERCIGCGACLVQAPPGMFVLDAQGKAVVTRPDQDWSPIDGEFIRHCPTYAISARPAAAPRSCRRRQLSTFLSPDRASGRPETARPPRRSSPPTATSGSGPGPPRAASMAVTRLSSSSNVKKYGAVPSHSRWGGMSETTTGVRQAIASNGVSPKPSNLLGQTTTSAVR